MKRTRPEGENGAAKKDDDDAEENIDELLSLFNSTAKKIVSVLEGRNKAVEEAEQKWHQVVTQIEKNIDNASSKISLDVGGQIFNTTKENLLRFPDTYFTGLLGSDKWKPDANGTYFIDRDPKGFDLVMRYMRGIVTEWSAYDQASLFAFWQHCDYFLLPVPQGLTGLLVDWWKEKIPPIFEITGKTVKMVGPVVPITASALLVPLRVPKPFNGNIRILIKSLKTNFAVGIVNETPSGRFIYTSGVVGESTGPTPYLDKASPELKAKFPLKSGTIITMQISHSKKELSFLIDGLFFVTLSLDFPLYSEETHRPAVVLYTIEDSVELLS